MHSFLRRKEQGKEGDGQETTGCAHPPLQVPQLWPGESKVCCHGNEHVGSARAAQPLLHVGTRGSEATAVPQRTSVVPYLPRGPLVHSLQAPSPPWLPLCYFMSPTHPIHCPFHPTFWCRPSPPWNLCVHTYPPLITSQCFFLPPHLPPT